MNISLEASKISEEIVSLAESEITRALDTDSNNLVGEFDSELANDFGDKSTSHFAQKNSKKTILLNLCKKNGYDEEIESRLVSEFTAFGPIDSLLSDDEITEVYISNWDQIHFEKLGQVFQSKYHFLSPRTYTNIFRKIVEDCHSEVSETRPYADGQWKGRRIHFVGPPISKNYTMTIRQLGLLSQPLELFLERQMFSRNEMDHLKNSVRESKNILIVGATGTGKTTLLNSLLRETSKTERTLVIEDTDEIQLPNKVSQKLLTRPKGPTSQPEIGQLTLLKQCLRMGPHRIVMGEVRGAEAKDFLMTLSTGHKGSLATLHASSASEALLRLEMLIQLGAPQWSLQAIRRLIYLSIDEIIVLEKKASRKLKGIYQIRGLEEFGLLVENVFEEN